MYVKYSSLCLATLNLQMNKVKFGFAPTNSVDSLKKQTSLYGETREPKVLWEFSFNAIALF